MGRDLDAVAVVGPFQVAARAQQPAAPRVRPARVRGQDPARRAAPVHLDEGILVPRGDDERVVARVVRQGVRVGPVGELGAGTTEGPVGLAPDRHVERVVADAVGIEGVEERPLPHDGAVRRELHDDIADDVLRRPRRRGVLLARGVVVERADLGAQRRQIPGWQFHHVVVQRVGVHQDAVGGRACGEGPRVPAAHDVAEEVDLDEQGPDPVDGRVVQQVAVGERDRVPDDVPGAVVPDDVARRVDGDQQAEARVAALRAPAVDVEQRRARLHPVGPAHGDLERREVFRQGLGGDGQRRRLGPVARGVRGDERDRVRPAGTQAREGQDVRGSIAVAELPPLDPPAVRDLDRQARGLVGRDRDPRAERRLGTGRLHHLEPLDRRRSPIGLGLRRGGERGNPDRQHRAADGRGSPGVPSHVQWHSQPSSPNRIVYLDSGRVHRMDPPPAPRTGMPQGAHGAPRRERRGAVGSPQADAGGSGRSPV